MSAATFASVRIRIGEQSLDATLADTPTVRDFVSLLPLELEMEDYAATEKIGYLPRKLDTSSAPAGTKPRKGDLSYYAPWGNVALFYRDFDYSPGLVKLGTIDTESDVIRQLSAGRVTVERIADRQNEL